MSHLAAVTRCISAYTTASPINVKFGDIKVDHLPWSWAYGTYILLMRWSRSHLRLDDRSKLTASGARVLGVILNDKLTATAGHVDNLLSASTGLMYALRVLRSHGIPPGSVHDVLRATVVSKITLPLTSVVRYVFSGGSCTSRLVSQPLQSDLASATRTYRQ